MDIDNATLCPTERNRRRVQRETSLAERLAYRVPEVVALSGLSRSTIFELIGSGALPSRLISGCRLVLRDDLVRFLEGKDV